MTVGDLWLFLEVSRVGLRCVVVIFTSKTYWNFKQFVFLC